MSTRRVSLMLCVVFCAGMLVLSLGSQHGAAQDKDHEFLPVADAMIVDQSPFDGVGDGVADDIFALFLNVPLAEARAVVTFDLGTINPNRIESATLRITSHGTGILPGTTTIPIQVNGATSDGPIVNDDFNGGSFITTFDGLATPDHTPTFIDVTEFVQGIRPSSERVLRFTLRTNVHGVSISYGSLDFGTTAALFVTLK